MIIIKSQIELSSREETDHRAQAKELKINRLAQRPAVSPVGTSGRAPSLLCAPEKECSLTWLAKPAMIRILSKI